MTARGVAITVMLSGYASGGQLGFPLAGALIGSTIGLYFSGQPAERSGLVGAGVLGIFSLLVMGRFFGALTTTNALLLFLAPVVGGLVILLPWKQETRMWRILLTRPLIVIDNRTRRPEKRLPPPVT